MTELIEAKKVSTFHPFFHIWMNCRYWSGEFERVVPESGGWLEWDAETTMAMMLCDDLYNEVKENVDSYNAVHNKPVPIGGHA